MGQEQTASASFTAFRPGALIATALLASFAGCYSSSPTISCTPCSATGTCEGTAQCQLGYCVKTGQDASRCPLLPGAGTAGSTGTVGTTGTGATSGNGSTSGFGSISCSRADGSTNPLLADAPLEIDCQGPAQSHYSVQANSLLQVADDLDATGKLTVSLPSSGLSLGFTDTNSILSITNSGGGSAQIPLPLVGNLLVGGAEGVLALASDGTLLGPLVPADESGTVSLLARLSDGSLLVGSNTAGLQRFSLNGTLLSTFDSTDHAGNALFSVDQEPWGAAEDGQGHVWVSRYSPSMFVNAILQFDDSGTYDQTIVPPGDLGGSDWIPLGIARLSDGTMAVASAGFAGGPTLALFAVDGTQVDVTLAFLTCKAPGNGGTPTCTNDNDDFGFASGLLVREGKVLVSTQNPIPGGQSFIGAFTNPDLGFLSSTARTSVTPQDGFAGTGGFNTLADDGVYVVAAQTSKACLVALDPRTLYLPMGWPDGQGCLPPEVTPPARPVVLHLDP